MFQNRKLKRLANDLEILFLQSVRATLKLAEANKKLQEENANLRAMNKLAYERQGFEFGIEDDVVRTSVMKFVDRHNSGMKQFGVTMAAKQKPLEHWLLDLQEEMMDAVNYIEKTLHDFNQAAPEQEEKKAANG